MSPPISQPDRRAFLGLAGVGLAATAAGLPMPAAARAQDQAVQFAAARRQDPRLVAFDSGQERDVERVRIEGVIPAALAGHFHRNGPAIFERAPARYHHWFDGDGFVQRWRIQNGAVSYRSRFLQTSKFAVEQPAGAFLLPVSGGGIAPVAAFSGANSANPSNTSIISMGAESWALWEGGSPMRVNPDTLETLGLVRLNSEVDGAPFSAHPRRGEDGRLWNVGSLGPRAFLWRLSASGALEAFRIQPLGQEGYYHDFLLTQRSLVLVQCSTEARGERSLERGTFHATRGVAGKPMRVHVFDRETFELVRQAELPSGFAFHFGNGWEEDDGAIHFDIAHSLDGDQFQEFFKPMTGRFPAWQAVSHRVTLPPKGAPRFERLHARVEFPKINPNYDARRNRFVYATTFKDDKRRDWFDSVVKIDVEQGRSQIFNYGAEWMVEEHVFVPRPGATREDDGWLVGTALNWVKQQTALTIFDAAHPDRPFLARAWLDNAMPLGLHGDFRRL